MWIVYHYPNLHIHKQFVIEESARRYVEWMIYEGYVESYIRVEEVTISIPQWKMWKTLQKEINE